MSHFHILPGALRGGTHRHEWSGDGKWIGFTYNDAILKALGRYHRRKKKSQNDWCFKKNKSCSC